MTNYAGKDLLLKIGTWSGGTVIGDCTAHTITFNNEQVEITNKSSQSWRTMLAGAGTKSVDISIEGKVSNDAAYETFKGYVNANSINTFSFSSGDSDTAEGSFAISNFSMTGAYNNEQTFTATLVSSGPITFTEA